MIDSKRIKLNFTRKISLRGNRISKISIDAFGDHHPNSIDLSRNKLVYLDKYVFEPLLMNDTFINVGGK